MLGKLLAPIYAGTNALVLGIPRGGVPVACEVAKAVDGELSAIITKKLPHPTRAGLAIGACAEDGSVFLSSYSREIDREMVRRIVQEQLTEIKDRVRRFRQGKRLPEIKGRTVILVDDGIATGSTVLPAIKLCQSEKARRVVVAAPVSGSAYVADVDALADEVVIVTRPSDFHAVGQVYGDSEPLTDDEVTAILSQHNREFYHGTTRKYV